VKFAFGKFVENAFGDSRGRAVIEGKGDTVAESRTAIDEGGVNFTLTRLNRDSALRISGSGVTSPC
jgi:hypothetical protein